MAGSLPARPPPAARPGHGLRLSSEARCPQLGYVRHVSLIRRHGLDLLIVLAAAAIALEIAFRDDPGISAWIGVPVAAAIALVLLARRWFRFGAPALVWLLGAGISFADGELIGASAGVTVAGMAAAFLLGQLPDPRQGRLGLAVVLGSAAIIVSNQPAHTAGDYVFVPTLFGIAWLAGFALRERSAQAEAAEEHAAAAEREREQGARLAVAEERARIARELHDIVAHSVSVIVLQVGAVRHNLPAGEDREALRGVEETGRTALADMRRLLGAMRWEGDDVDLAPQPGLGSLGPLLDEFRRAGLAVRLDVAGEPVSLPPTLDLSAYRIV